MVIVEKCLLFTQISLYMIFYTLKFVGIIGNSLVLLTILLQKQMRSTTNILILNLAFAELLFILLCVPFTGLNYVLRYVILYFLNTGEV